MIQISLESKIFNPVYIEDIKIDPFSSFIFVPLSEEYFQFNNRMKKVFERTQCMKNGDKRFYFLEVRKQGEETPEELHKYYIDKKIELGNLRITWVNSFGERNMFYANTIVVPYEIRSEYVSVKIMNMPKALYLEEPKVLKLKITNLLPTEFSFKLYIRDDEAKSIIINALSMIVNVNLINRMRERFQDSIVVKWRF